MQVTGLGRDDCCDDCADRFGWPEQLAAEGRRDLSGSLIGAAHESLTAGGPLPFRGLAALVGMRGFEPPASPTRTVRATRLRHIPKKVCRRTTPDGACRRATTHKALLRTASRDGRVRTCETSAPPARRSTRLSYIPIVKTPGPDSNRHRTALQAAASPFRHLAIVVVRSRKAPAR